MSQARAISKPPPKAAPSIAAIVGTGKLPVKEKTALCTMNQLHQPIIQISALFFTR